MVTTTLLSVVSTLTPLEEEIPILKFSLSSSIVSSLAVTVNVAVVSSAGITIVVGAV